MDEMVNARNTVSGVVASVPRHLLEHPHFGQYLIEVRTDKQFVTAVGGAHSVDSPEDTAGIGDVPVIKADFLLDEALTNPASSAPKTTKDGK